MSESTQPAGQRRFGKLPAASEYCGLSRATLYELAPKHPGLFRKSGTATLVDFRILDAILDALPNARIKPATRATNPKE
jgi:hypothetical protein